MADLFTISSSALPDATRVIALRGVEAISRPYEIELYLSLEGEEGDGVDLADAIGAQATLTVDRTGDALQPYFFTGILAGADLVHAVEGRSLVRATLVPRLWLLGLSVCSRIFTKKSLPEIITSVLEDNGIVSDDYELRLGRYETEEHVCQYRESDLAFLSRWMEREGIYYYFVHSEGGEKIIFSDSRAYEDDILGRPIRYFPQLGADGSAGPSFRAFTSKRRTLPSKVRLRDYDYARPNLSVSGSASVSRSGAGEVSLYGERFFTPAAGERLAKLRAEELLAREVVYTAKGTRTHLRAGHTFELEDHPRSALNQKYLAIEVRHHGNQLAGASHFKEVIEIEHPDVYYCEVDAIPATTQFRPASEAPWPRIFGYENGVVDGAADSDYAQIDDQGRYSVRLKFDEGVTKAGSSSTFVRMMQPHGGGVEGFHFPLRKGTEVVVSFLGGDPDRPVISGVVPNALTPSPVTSGNHTKNIIQTGGRNRIEMEDKAGQERFTLSTPHANTYIRMGSPNDGSTMILNTDMMTSMHVGSDLMQFVGYIQKGGVWCSNIWDNWTIYSVQGGISTGIMLSPPPAEPGKYALKSLSDISLKTTTGDYHLDVDLGKSTTNIKGETKTTVSAGAYIVDVTGGETEIVNHDCGTRLASQKRMVVASLADDTLIYSENEMTMQSSSKNITLRAPKGDISLITPDKTITVDCTTFTNKADDRKAFWSGPNFELAAGKWTLLKGGDVFEASVSASFEISASFKMALTLAIALEASFGVSIKNAAGPAEIKIASIGIRKKGIKIDLVDGAKIAKSLAWMKKIGVAVIG